MDKNMFPPISVKYHNTIRSSTNLNNTDIIRTMETIWRNEKFSKEILKYESDFLNELLTEIEKKQEEINKNLYDKDDTDLMEIDLQRVIFLIKDYLRIRICKIEKYLFHIIRNDLSSLFSPQEIELICNLIQVKALYFNEGLKRVNPVLNEFRAFTDKYKSMGEKINCINESMIVTPPTNSYVCVQSISQEPLIFTLKDVYEESFENLTMNKDDVCCLPFQLVKEYLGQQKVKLI